MKKQRQNSKAPFFNALSRSVELIQSLVELRPYFTYVTQCQTQEMNLHSKAQDDSQWSVAPLALIC